MEKTTYIKNIMAASFCALLLLAFVQNRSYSEIKKMMQYLFTNQTEEEQSVTMEGLESDFVQNLAYQQFFVELNGSLTRFFGFRDFYQNDGIYITKDNICESAYEETTTDYELSQAVEFRDFLQENGIQLLYVNEPTKYLEDADFENEFGVETYSNRNADRLLERLSAEEIPVVDLREEIRSEDKDMSSLFYRTDHHWNALTGLWATGKIAQALNESCGYQIDEAIYDESNYNVTEMESCWLGEQGRKVGASYLGLDDYLLVKPKFETDFTFKNGNVVTYEGSFDQFINEEALDSSADLYETESWHYAYSRINCINNRVQKGKIFFICDSYDHVTEPFLALGVHEIDSVILRDIGEEFDLRSYILENGYDTVIVAYAQLMIGAHDDENSANYRMFTFQ